MVRRKTLSPSGSTDDNGEYRNAHINLHQDELTVAGFDIGDEVYVRTEDDAIVIQHPKDEADE
jgi:hypothetical protein